MTALILLYPIGVLATFCFLALGYGPPRLKEAIKTDRAVVIAPALLWPVFFLSWFGMSVSGNIKQILGMFPLRRPKRLTNPSEDLFLVQAMREVDALFPHTDQITPPEYRETPPEKKVVVESVPTGIYLGEIVEGAYQTLLERRGELCSMLKQYPIACQFAGTRRMFEKVSDIDDLISELGAIRTGSAHGLQLYQTITRRLTAGQIVADQIVRQKTHVEPLVFNAIIMPGSTQTIVMQPQKNFRPLYLVYKGPQKTFRLCNFMIGNYPNFFHGPKTVSMDYFRPTKKQASTNLGDCDVCRIAMNIVLVVQNIRPASRTSRTPRQPNFEVVMYGEVTDG